jgi:uncharacterized protein YdaU (DUF1376 family)
LNYYERHLGDYAKDTGHLSMLEHGAYTLLLDRYYGTERGIPADDAYRQARAKTQAERAAVDAVLREFFTLTDGCWVKTRVEQEIAKAQKRIGSARENGLKGGRPPKETQQEPSGFPVGSDSETQSKALHTPDTRHHSVDKLRKKRASAPPCPDGVSDQTWADWLALRSKKRAPVTATVLDEAQRESDKAGMSIEAFLRVWCARGSQGLQADWLRPNERASVTSFSAEKASRYEEMSPGIGAKKPASAQPVEVIDVAARFIR